MNALPENSGEKGFIEVVITTLLVAVSAAGIAVGIYLNRGVNLPKPIANLISQPGLTPTTTLSKPPRSLITEAYAAAKKGEACEHDSDCDSGLFCPGKDTAKRLGIPRDICAKEVVKGSGNTVIGGKCEWDGDCKAPPDDPTRGYCCTAGNCGTRQYKCTNKDGTIPTSTPIPTLTPGPKPTNTPTPTPVPVTTASVVLAEDPQFTINVQSRRYPQGVANYLIGYTFSDPSPGTKTLYIKYIASDGSQQNANPFPITIQLSTLVSTPTPSPSPLPTPTLTPTPTPTPTPSPTPSPTPLPTPIATPTPTLTPTPTPLPTTAPTSSPTPTSSPIPTSIPTTASVVLAEDPNFSINVQTRSFPQGVASYSLGYTFSDPAPGLKTLYIKYIASDGREQNANPFPITIQLSVPVTSTPIPTPTPLPTPTPTPTLIPSPTPSLTPLPTPSPTPLPTPTPTPVIECTCYTPGGIMPNNGFGCTDGTVRYCAANERCTSSAIRPAWPCELFTPTPTPTPIPTPTSTPIPTPTVVSSFQPQAPYYAAFFYPWYVTTSVDGWWGHWQDEGHSPPQNWFANFLPDVDTSVFNPQRELYSSSDESIIYWQLRKMAEAKIEIAISSWWGQNDTGDAAFRHIVTDVMNRLDNPYPNLRWAIYYEDEGFGDPSIEQIVSDLMYIKNNYTNQRSYLKINGKPVVFTYNEIPGDDAEYANRWSQARDQTGFYVVGKTFPNYELVATLLDSWHTYDTLSREGLDPSFDYHISPGYWKAGESPRLSRDINAFRTAVSNMVNANVQWKLIETWNEWGEGSSVEPGDQVIQTKSGAATLNPNGAQFKNSYIDILSQTLPALEQGTGALPTPTPVPVTTASVVLSEDPNFTVNVQTRSFPQGVASYSLGYTFSDPSPGTKTLYVKYTASDGREQNANPFPITVQIAVPTPTSIPTPGVSDLINLIEDVQSAKGYRYDAKDNQWNCLDTIKIIEGEGSYRYLGIYHCYNGSIFRVLLGSSNDLLNWNYITEIDSQASQPTIQRLSNGSYLVIYESSVDGNHLRFRYYPNISALTSNSYQKQYDAQRTLSPRCSEGTPNVYSVSLSPDIDHSDIEVGFHFHQRVGNSCTTDKIARGNLTNFSSWSAREQTAMNQALGSLGVNGNMGDRDYFSFTGKLYNLQEGQLTRNDFGSWRSYLYDFSSGSFRLLNVRTHTGAVALANPTITFLTLPDGQPGFVAAFFIFGGGQLIYYK